MIKGDISRLKQHIPYYKGQVADCARVTILVHESMMKLLMDRKAKKIDSRKRKEEFEACLRGNDEDIEDHIDKHLRLAPQESLRSHHEWKNRQWFKQQTRGLEYVYELDGSSYVSVSGATRSQDISFTLKSIDINLGRSRSTKQRKVSIGSSEKLVLALWKC